ncbi:S8 family serine peptidase [Streptomyces sp. NBC_00208]|uniref:S8 family serine peptidase n=1 Tax=Streptomyces sp. NBC_00208 TaxID=2975681 RepID=UPI002E2B9EFA|nr:S8 family serine peptidase [Streptomyces sp. NBC_00208]
MRRIRLWAVISMSAVMATGAVVPVAAQSPPGTEARTSAPHDRTTTVRLITGDLVTVSGAPNGKKTASVQRAPGREKVFFRITEKDGALTVLPSDAAMLVRTERLDADLFNVTSLIAQGYDETHTEALPLIVSAPKGSARAAVKRLDALAKFHEGSAGPRRLPSIDAQALRVADQDLAAFWKKLVPAAGASMTSAAATTPKIWLDHKVRPTLDRSTAQINAPAAWAAGYHGEGVKVAVLDTGADQTHPDLAGRVSEAKDFSSSGSTEDHFGHGTHVAATVGGGGADSDGRRKGVAPSADLLIGKVLGDDGSGGESEVIAGMEWAAAQGAKVVNMSLGADMETDGTDPMSLAVNEISRSSGALFVVAAGNSGPGPTTVGSPGAADAALTVGAVDRDDKLASFSSRGPRFGDKAAKPDITAPGVGIVAARAAGTLLGEPVGDHYVKMSGTSMATPHVAGAAALLAGQHPDWSAQQLKDALVSTSRTVSGQVPTEQGGGRVDVKAAVSAPVTATGTMVLGPFDRNGSPVERVGVVRYTNHSDDEVSLNLRAALATMGGKVLPAQALTLGAETVRVAPGATAEVPVGIDPSKAGRGSYYGYVTATSADGVPVHTTVSLWVRAPMHKLTIESHGPTGDPIRWELLNLFGGDAETQVTSLDPLVVEVEEGTYQVDGTTVEWTATGARMIQVVEPEVKVTKDMTVTLDTRKTKLVRVRTPKPAVRRNDLTYQMYRKIDGLSLNATLKFALGGAEAVDLYVNPTSKVTDGEFEFNSRWEMTAPQIRTEVRGTDIDLKPYYVQLSTPFDSKGEQLTAVDAGTRENPDLRSSTVQGKLAVIRDETAAAEYDLAEKAAKAGAKGLVIVLPKGMLAWTPWKPTDTRSAIPTIRVDATDGAALLRYMEKHKAVIDISGTVESPYLYDIRAIWEHQIPQDVTYTVSDRNTAQVKATYTDTGSLDWSSEQRFSWRPYSDYSVETSRWVPTGMTRTEYVTSGDTQWRHHVDFITNPWPIIPLLSGLRDAPRTFASGEQVKEEWFKAVVRPSIPRGWNRPSVRSGDVLSLAIPEFTDAATGHWARRALPHGAGGIGTAGTPGTMAVPIYPQGDTVAAVLYRDGEKVGEAAAAWGDFEVPAGSADYRLDLTTERKTEYWQTGTRTATSWTFRSDSAAKETLLPLLQVDYGVRADLSNTVGGGKRHNLDLTVRNQDGLTAPTGVRLKVEASFDDGKTWKGQVRVKDRGHNRFTATVERPGEHRQGAYVTLRVTASDKAGNTVRQTVERAYLLGK